MNNIKELMKTANKYKYTKKQKKEILSCSYMEMGETRYLIICMEEIAELIDVASESINSKCDYIHLAEEIVDVMISIEIMKVIFGIKDSELTKIDKKKSKKNSRLISSIQNLSKAQQNISKYLRYGEEAESKIIPALNMMNESVYYISDIFKIKNKDIDKIQNLKYKRLEERIKSGSLH